MFMGHLLPAIYLMVTGLCLCYNIFYNYFASKLQIKFEYLSQPWYRSVISGKKYPLYIVFQLLVITIGIIGQLFTGFDSDGQMYTDNIQHIVVYISFTINGLIGLSNYFKCFHMPDGLEYLSLSFAFATQGFIMANHLHGRTTLDAKIHLFYTYSVFFCAICIILEMCFKKNPLPALCRAYSCVIQGTWLLTVAFILYLPEELGLTEKWDEENHRNLMIVIAMFVANLQISFVSFFFFGLFVKRIVTRHNCSKSHIYNCKIKNETDVSPLLITDNNYK
ncbi:hypothetical protein CHUAL_001032 [Chamberlinius hualienensis]